MYSVQSPQHPKPELGKKRYDGLASSPIILKSRHKLSMHTNPLLYQQLKKSEGVKRPVEIQGQQSYWCRLAVVRVLQGFGQVH